MPGLIRDHGQLEGNDHAGLAHVLFAAGGRRLDLGPLQQPRANPWFPIRRVRLAVDGGPSGILRQPQRTFRTHQVLVAAMSVAAGGG